MEEQEIGQTLQSPRLPPASTATGPFPEHLVLKRLSLCMHHHAFVQTDAETLSLNCMGLPRSPASASLTTQPPVDRELRHGKTHTPCLFLPLARRQGHSALSISKSMNGWQCSTHYPVTPLGANSDFLRPWPSVKHPYKRIMRGHRKQFVTLG